ncbi:MAG: poly-gamma-glutamate hydrolase family protein [Ilumatobacteraceae bacterium]|nr:poly-gamma-glutamate hydrolase family protein [Ilumatobacteraceae bacterium]
MFRELLDHPEVDEVLVLRGHDRPRELRLGFMAYHGGGLEEMTEVVAQHAAEHSDASYYGVHQPRGMERHIPSIEVSPDASERLRAFLDHVHAVVTIHGYGRQGYYSTLLLGGQHRDFARHIAGHLRRHLPAYRIIDDVDEIPKELRGLHPRNPVNLPPAAGVQIELPPRVRGTTPMFWDWEGPALPPHTQSLVNGLVEAARAWLRVPDAR